MATATSERDTDTGEQAAGPRADRRAITIRVSTVLTWAVIAASVVAAGVFASLWLGAKNDLAQRDGRAADDKRVQQIATDYALGASTIDYRDTKAWFDKLKANTAPPLAAKFDASAPQLEQILMPLQWTSKATPITAVVLSENNGVFKANVFLNVTSTSAQTPQGVQTTVTYSLTIDKNSDWKITDVGGLDGALPVK